jgi:hypothetical protein
MNKRVVILLIILGGAISASTQDIDAIESKVKTFSLKKGIKMSGSLSLNTITYAAHGMQGRRDPFNWFANSNININLFGLDVPFSFSYTDARVGYTQPFNKIRFSPKYKWIKTYIGTTNMNFSSYTLAGHQFKGFGIELTPGKWRLMAMRGKLKEAIPYTDVRNAARNTTASFKRTGLGVKLGYENNGQGIEGIFFKAKDDINSIPFIPPGGLVTPKENVVVGISGKKKIGRRMFVNMEYAISGLTGDLRSDTAKKVTRNYSLLAKYIKSRNTTRFTDAANFGIGYTGNSYSIQLKYERVSPEYETLGAYYFNSDLENYTIMPSIRLFKGKINFSGNIGIQRDNLNKQKTSTTKRFVGNMNVNVILNEKWNIAGTYSNFSTYTNVRPISDPFYQDALDTLNFYQVNQTFTGMAGFNFGNRLYRNAIMLTASYQKASDQGTETNKESLSDFYSGNLSYTLSITKKAINLASGFSYNKNTTAGNQAVFMGPTFSLNNSLFKNQVKNSLAMAYNKSLSNGIVSNDVLNLRWSLSFATSQKEEVAKKAGGDTKPSAPQQMAMPAPGESRLKKEKAKFIAGHSITFSVSYTEKFKNSIQKNSFREMVINAGYVFNFR